MPQDEPHYPEEIQLRDLTCLLRRTPDDYREQPLPHERDLAVADLLHKAVRIDGLDQLVALVRPEVEADTLRTFALRMASLAVRRDNADLLRLGLLAVGIAGQHSIEGHDDVWVLAPLWRTAARLGLDPRTEFMLVAITLPATETFFGQWCARPADRQSLASMGYRESADADGFRYVWEHEDLVRAAENLAHAGLSPWRRFLLSRRYRRWIRQGNHE